MKLLQSRDQHFFRFLTPKLIYIFSISHRLRSRKTQRKEVTESVHNQYKTEPLNSILATSYNSQQIFSHTVILDPTVPRNDEIKISNPKR